MVINRSGMRIEKKEKMRGGEGTVSLVHLVECETEKNIRMLAELTLPPGASIGDHRHDGETEYFLVLSGGGMVNDNGEEKAVKPGDTIITGNGAFHGVKNTGTEPLVMHAVIVTY
ncbi:MAG: cupin domain-containing protein [Treponema sp.]|jgi:quercetin dioxygenase-like cupin family protein|nr:cupin domain-containing protein [Treponema sp.]